MFDLDKFLSIPIDDRSYEDCLEAIKHNINFIPEDKRTKEIYLKSVEFEGGNIQYISEKYITEELCLVSVKQNGHNIAYISEDKRTEKVCLEAIKQTGFAIQYIEKYKLTEEMCLEAIKKNIADRKTINALIYIPKKFITKEIVQLILDSGNATKFINYLPDDIRPYI
jgi:hypothetical protein